MIFLDTSFFVALRNRRDAHHDEAVTLLDRRHQESMITTNHVRGETWTYLRRKAGHGSAVDFLDGLEASPRMRLIFVSQEIESAALTWLRRHDEREYSFVHATSFAVMKSLKIRDALTFGGDFAAAGFNELRA